MSTFVVDASVAVKWVVAEADSDAATRLARHDLLAPELMLIEAGNALWSKARRGELSDTEAEERLEALVAMPVLLIPSSRLAGRALDLALRLGHTVYDGLYVALARVRGVPLVTADLRLTRTVRECLHEAGVVITLDELSEHRG